MMSQHYVQKEAAGNHIGKVLIISGLLVTLFVILPILLLGWLGFVPGLSDILGAKNARDLGVRYNQDDYESYQRKLNVEFKDYTLAPRMAENPDSRSILQSPRTVDSMSITQEELSAAINAISLSWLPVKNTQLRLSDGVVEISGNVDSEKLQSFESYINDAGNTSNNIDTAITWLNRFAEDVPFFAKANVDIVNNTLNLRLTEAQVGRLDIPLGSLGNDLEQGFNNIRFSAENLDVKSAQLQEGQMLFTGTYPTQIYVQK